MPRKSIWAKDYDKACRMVKHHVERLSYHCDRGNTEYMRYHNNLVDVYLGQMSQAFASYRKGKKQ
jgi:hypothetical protein